MDKVKVRHWQGDIVAQVPFELKDVLTENVISARFVNQTDRSGRQVKYWKIPSSPFVAWQIRRLFGGWDMEMDDETKSMADGYEKAWKIKHSDCDSSSIPGLTRWNPKDGTLLTPWPHQVKAFWFMIDLPGAMLAFDMGTGKTLTAIALIVNGEHKKVLIVCPKSVMSVWPDEIRYAKVQNFRVCTLDGNQRVARKAIRLRNEIAIAESKGENFIGIVNYDAVWREEIAKVVLNHEWDVLVGDELHRAKSYSNTARAAKFMAKIGRQSRRRIGLTGTPMPHSPLDIFAQYKMLDPGIFGDNFHKFKMKYAVMGGYGGKQVIGFKNQEDLSVKFKSISFQVSKDVLKLPEAIHSYRTCDLTARARKIYNELDKQLFAEIEEGTISPANAMVKVLRLQQLTSGYVSLDDSGGLVEVCTAKRDLLKDLLLDIPHDEPVIIFCRFTADIGNVRKVCADKEVGRDVGELSGKMNNLKEWQDGKTNVLATQIRSGGVGIDLVRARYCIYYSIGHSLGDYLQSLDRSHRYGQTRTVNYYHLLAENTIDQKVYNALQKRQDIIESILNYKKS